MYENQKAAAMSKLAQNTNVISNLHRKMIYRRGEAQKQRVTEIGYELQ